jgi:hypothetical protein
MSHEIKGTYKKDRKNNDKTYFRKKLAKKHKARERKNWNIKRQQGKIT